MNKTKVMLIVLIAFLVGGVTAIGFIIHYNNKQKSDSSEDYMATVVLDGFELDIPNKYMATLQSDGVLMYWSNDEFYIKISVLEGNYQKDVLDCLDEYREVMGSELKVINPYKEIAIEGNSYVYMLYEDVDTPIIHGFKEADSEHIFEIMILCYDMEAFKPMSEEAIERSCEEKILITDSVLSTAKATDKENVYTGEIFVGDGAYEEYYSEMDMYHSKEYVDNDRIYYAGNEKSVKYGIEENFYLIGEVNKENYYKYKKYTNYDENMKVTVIVDETMKQDFDVKSLAKESLSQWGDADSSVEEITVGNQTYYYFTYMNSFLEQDGVVDEYIMVFVTELLDGVIYRVEVKLYDEEKLDINNFMKFLEIE